jgi:hypothetical protein
MTTFREGTLATNIGQGEPWIPSGWKFSSKIQAHFPQPGSSVGNGVDRLSERRRITFGQPVELEDRDPGSRPLPSQRHSSTARGLGCPLRPLWQLHIDSLTLSLKIPRAAFQTRSPKAHGLYPGMCISGELLKYLRRLKQCVFRHIVQVQHRRSISPAPGHPRCRALDNGRPHGRLRMSVESETTEAEQGHAAHLAPR